MQKTASNDQARAEVARVLSAYLEETSRKFIAQGKTSTAPINQERLTPQIRIISQHSLSRAKIRGSWRDPKAGIVYSAAELDLRQIKNALTAVDTNAELRL